MLDALLILLLLTLFLFAYFAALFYNFLFRLRLGCFGVYAAAVD